MARATYVWGCAGGLDARCAHGGCTMRILRILTVEERLWLAGWEELARELAADAGWRPEDLRAVMHAEARLGLDCALRSGTLSHARCLDCGPGECAPEATGRSGKTAGELFRLTELERGRLDAVLAGFGL